METTEEERMTDPEQMYKGFCIDLLNILRGTLHFKYAIHVVADGSYGAQDPDTGEWNGILGEIITGVSRD